MSCIIFLLRYLMRLVLLQALKFINVYNTEILFHMNRNYIHQYKNMQIYCFLYHAAQITIIFFNEHSSASQTGKKTKDLTYSLSAAILTAVKGHLE